jgi:hypothetical protein
MKRGNVLGCSKGIGGLTFNFVWGGLDVSIPQNDPIRQILLKENK